MTGRPYLLRLVFVLLLVSTGREYADAAGGEVPALASLTRTAQDGGRYSYVLAMLGLGLGSLLFCRVLLLAGLVPRFLAVWGLAGYAILATGMTLELLGFDVGLALALPGGLFEVALGVLLVGRGFPANEADPSLAQRHVADEAA